MTSTGEAELFRGKVFVSRQKCGVDPAVCWFRTELLKLLLTCFSEAMYLPPSSERNGHNPWVWFFCSSDNR